MNVKLRDTAQGTVVEVILSHRNLEDLQRLWEGYKDGYSLPYIQRRCENNMVLRVVVEPDETHYSNREPGPGADYILGPRSDTA